MTARLAVAQQAIEEDADPHPSPPVPIATDGGRGLRKFMLKRFKSGVYTAKDLCCLAYHCTHAGATGVDDLQLHPDSSSGNFSRHVRKVLKMKGDETFFTARVPMWNHDSQSRYLCPFPFHLPHDIFASGYERNPANFDFNHFDTEQLPPRFFEHPVMVEHGPKVTPLGYFSDGVPFTKSDSFISYYLSNALTGERYMICSLRKSDVCKCSCAGNCTYGTILRVLAWSFNQVAEGVYPAFDHLGQPFADEMRSAKRGFPLAEGFHRALVGMRADLLEFVGAVGFKQWGNTRNPCFCCGTPKSDLFAFPRTMSESRWAPRDATAYEHMVRNATVRVQIQDKRMLKLLMRSLRLDADCGGLALMDDFPLPGLKKGYRVIEEDSVTDVHNLDGIGLPATICFSLTAAVWD